MRFEWDERKNRMNLQKHSLRFELAKEAFSDPFRLTIADQTVESEERFWMIGRLENLVIVVIVHTIRDENGDEAIRIISARKATPRERRTYEEADR